MFNCSRVSKNFTTMRGISVFSIENLLSHSAEYFRRGSFTVAKISGMEKVWLRVGGGKIKIFVRNFFYLTVPKIFVGEPFCAVF